MKIISFADFSVTESISKKSQKHHLAFLSDNYKQFLLKIARQAVVEAVSGAKQPTLPEDLSMLFKQASVFVGLYYKDLLRGCMDRVDIEEPLDASIVHCAWDSALYDARFPPISKRELPYISIKIGLLSCFFDILPNEIEVGLHGLHITFGPQRALLLPEAAKPDWTKEQFLAELCLKAKLHPNAWQYGAKLQAFTTLEFSS